MLNKNKFGVVIGAFLALMHLVWALAVAITPLGVQNFLDWIFKLHFLKTAWIIDITYISFLNGLLLVVVTFIVGYIFGWVFAWLRNLLKK